MLNIKKYKQIEMKFKALIDQSISTKSFNLFQYKQLIENEDPLYIITIIRKNGFFRPSKYDYETYIIDHLYGLIQEDKKYLDFKNYLQSVENLKNLSREIKKTHVKLKKYISSRKSLLKYFLAKADDIYFHRKYENCEFIIECISYLILECKKNQNNSNPLDIINLEKINEKKFRWLIKLSEIILIFKKTEIKIDFFNHTLEKSYLTYNLSNDGFEKNLSYSYYIYTQQRSIIQKSSLKENKDSISFEDMCSKIFSSLKIEHLAEVRKYPFQRVCPKIILHPEMIELFSTDYLYPDEISLLDFILDESFLSTLDIKEYIYKNFTLIDIIKIQRFFIYFSIAYRVAIDKINIKNKENILIQSIIPTFTERDLNISLQKIYKDDKNYYQLIKYLFSIDFFSTFENLDIQYSPIIFYKNYLMLSPTLIGKSNLIRSSLLKLKINISTIKKNDSMIDHIKGLFENNGFQIKTDVTLGDIEIDIIAKKNNQVFIFECKNSYHPVNDFELRNVYAHIDKASKQLEKIKVKISDPQNRKNLSKKIGFSLYQVDINYAIINSNRIFNGYLNKGYRCISSHFLSNILQRGFITVNNKKYNLRRSANFHEFDLIDVINGKFISDYEKLAHEDFQVYEIGFSKIKIQRFGYSPEQIFEHIANNYPMIDL